MVPSTSARVSLPVVPLLDISFQLMFFMVITFNAAPTEGRIPLELPQMRGDRSNTTVVRDDQFGIDLPVDVVVVVRADSTGQMQLAVREDGRVDAVADSNALVQQLQAKHHNQANLQIEADGKMPYGRIVQVMDACKKAGYESISFATPLEN
jgi:biopolymer transport protein ExbD